MWDPKLGVLWWVDIPRGEVHQFDPASGRDLSIEVGEDVGAVVPCAADGMILALRTGISILDRTGTLTPVAALQPHDPRLRFNDARCDPCGRLWAGTVRDDQAPGTAALYCLEPGGQLDRRLDGVTISNGLDWSLGGDTFYYADSGRGTVDAFEFDLEHGSLGRRRPFVRIDPADGFPDGLCVDAEGFVWVAVFGSWTVHRYAPNGRLDRRIDIPARDVTSVAFGGSSLDVMYVTSASERLDRDDWLSQPRAGGIFSCRPGPCGRPQQAWVG